MLDCPPRSHTWNLIFLYLNNVWVSQQRVCNAQITWTVSTLKPIAIIKKSAGGEIIEHQAHWEWSKRLRRSVTKWELFACLGCIRIPEADTISLSGTRDCRKQEKRPKESNYTFPAESKPSIRIRTSWSLPHRTSDAKEEKSVDIERPMRVKEKNMSLTRRTEESKR